MSDVAIRQVSAGDDLAGYRRLRVKLWPDCGPDNDREIAEIVASPEWAVFVAVDGDGAAVGFLEVRLREYAEGAAGSPVPYIEGWFVEEERRRYGIGSALVRAAEGWAVSCGYREMASDCQVENAVSLAAHERSGYREVERQVCFLKRLE